MMRVLMATPGYYPIRGGTEAMVKTLSVELNKAGIETEILTFNMDRKWRPRWRGRVQRIDGVTVFKVPALNWFPMEHSARVTMSVNLIPGRFTHLLSEFDIVHFHEIEFSLPLFSSFVKKPKILHSHGIDLAYFQRYHLSRFMLTHAADIYLAITRRMKSEMAQLGIDQDRIVYFPNSVDTGVFRPGEKADNTVLYVGRITPDKGLHVLLKALKFVTTSVNLLVVGPRDWDARYCDEALEMMEAVNHEGRHRVTYLGRVDKATLLECYQKASVFVLPSVSEPFGVVLLEAFACQTPVVATNAGGVPEVVKDGQNGILVPVNNPERLAAAIQYLIDNEKVRRKFGREGRKWVLENFSLEGAVQKLCTIYRRMAESQADA